MRIKQYREAEARKKEEYKGLHELANGLHPHHKTLAATSLLYIQVIYYNEP